MGSKRKLAKEIVSFILKENPNCKYIYDLFGGGGAISFEAIQRPQIKQVFYNEFNAGVVNLLKDIKTIGIRDEYYKWVDRDTFLEYKNKDCWKGGLIKTCWSFGNDQNSYIFGKEIEEDKRLLHEVIVNDCFESLSKFNQKFKTDIKLNDECSILEKETMKQKRLRICGEMRRNSRRLDMEQLQRLQNLQQLERLQQLEQLQRLQNLQQLERLNITNLSYEQVEISTPPDETIVYLDPPYEDTKNYQKGISHEELYKWINESPHKIYLSSYESPLPCVKEIKHRSTLSSTANNEVVEKIFTNDYDSPTSDYRKEVWNLF